MYQYVIGGKDRKLNYGVASIVGCVVHITAHTHSHSHKELINYNLQEDLI